MRVTTGFNRMLGLRGALVRDVAFGQEAVIVTVVLRANLWAASSMYLSATTNLLSVLPLSTSTILKGEQRRVSTKSLGSGRRVASLGVALACACTLLASLLVVNANAAGKVVVAARPSARTGALHSKKPVSSHRVSKRARVSVSPFGTGVYFQQQLR